MPPCPVAPAWTSHRRGVRISPPRSLSPSPLPLSVSSSAGQTLAVRPPPAAAATAVPEPRRARCRLRHPLLPVPPVGIEPERTEMHRPTPTSSSPATTRRRQIRRLRALSGLLDSTRSITVSSWSSRTLPPSSSPSGAGWRRAPPSATAPEHAAGDSGDLLVSRAALPVPLAPLSIPALSILANFALICELQSTGESPVLQ